MHSVNKYPLSPLSMTEESSQEVIAQRLKLSCHLVKRFIFRTVEAAVKCWLMKSDNKSVVDLRYTCHKLKLGLKSVMDMEGHGDEIIF